MGGVVTPRIVILVEDHAPVRELYAAALRSQGWQVLERPNARGLGELALRTHAEAVVLDWGLPDESGLDALLALKRSPATRHLRVLMLTAHASEELRRRALLAGAEQYLQKPLLPAVLAAALAQSAQEAALY